MSTETTVDQLGVIKARIADLKTQEAALKTELILQGIKVGEGKYFRVTISTSIRRTLNTALIRKLVPKAILRKAEKEAEVTTVRVTARKGIVAPLQAAA